MADLSLPQAIERLKGNELRIQDFVNGNAAGYYVTSGGVQVETLPSFQTRLAAAIVAANNVRADLAKANGASLVGYGQQSLQAYLDAQALVLASTKTAAEGALPRAGGTMTGALVLAGAPTSGLHATTKDYVDGQAVQSGYLELTQSGTFPKPANAKWVYVELLGAGAGGDFVATVPANGASYAPGGGGGDMNARLFRISELDASTSVTIGFGGIGGTTGATFGANGGNTTFGTKLTAKGGQRSASYQMGGTYAPPHSWAGGEPGRVTQNGSSQATGVSVGGRSIRGGGGGGGSNGSNYGAIIVGGADGGESSEAGSGGAGSKTAGANGVDGTYPAGGGGACVAGTKAGNGANGRARIWWW